MNLEPWTLNLEPSSSPCHVILMTSLLIVAKFYVKSSWILLEIIWSEVHLNYANTLNTTFCTMKWLLLISMQCLLPYIHWFMHMYTLLWGQWRGSFCIRTEDKNCTRLSLILDFLFLVSHTNFSPLHFTLGRSCKINSFGYFIWSGGRVADWLVC